MSQRERVLDALRGAGGRGVCVADMPVDLGYCARNRVSDLRASGLDIRSERCLYHDHTGPVFRYRLVEAPRQEQMAL